MRPGVIRTGMLMVVLWWGAPVCATEDLPEVLRYAREYVHAKQDGGKQSSGKTVRKLTTVTPTGTAQQLARTELIRRQQQIKINELEKRLKEQASERGRLMTERDAARAALEQTREQKVRQSSEEEPLQTRVRQAETVLKQKNEEVALLKTTLSTMKTQQEQLLEKLRLSATKTATQKKLNLTETPARQAYATGVMFARDVREAQEGNRLLGIELDKQALLAGLNDGLSGEKLRLTPEELAKAGQSVEEAASKGYQAVTTTQKKKAEKFLKTFMKQKGARTAEQGFWYQVSYPGDGAWLQDEDVVDVVVEESLTDGTVVSDMDRSGSSLRQAVKAFPPVFAAGLKHLRNHGQITLVVPPDLAYGERGYPPSVPPGATMVYRIRVSDVVSPEAEKQKPAEE
ncbi:FKBP-type peptidyl-prolyl cis-trans isomerase [Salmonella enterica subsp. enterica serovar Thompson]|nr:hypothetical protein [Salmonella enterica subsp. enterica serovar Newport]EDT1690143.1 hypothetical protein [Salmonella enterica subsp. enterica serovar Oslo]ELP3484156.1 FKBP-type peptidyl-prolyl cis-trans isomerase [Salmonella enterica]EDH9202587.1 hypothetical protein [Salmonella enterica subsp. enterica serovar Newport]EJO8772294.1 FKBP-type peptidyl-prolyl cis-trans isomerase [Salmonella enterica subsp. enterica serovar Newport]